ncbi:sensor histidine kinase [Collimonas sp.]|jgi:two-component system sensor histidine kinase TctE|uniref:sensor histidine kinase n=1 Tax=Collimonas sp. TaxID=1963772 RepID=UPI002C93D311|nr:sensor histidine kinase N-terminal domain-containing protein [Collimonas sp.]HWX03014.1 sensor histidine kinase N-terminal domain-containing protein [Collimonas sp.]
MRFNSLRSQLLLWLLVPLVLFVAFNAWVTYNNAIEMATVVHDRMLLGSARIIAEQIRYEDEALQATIPPAALELFQSDAHDLIYYRVVTSHGALLAGQPDLPAPPKTSRNEEAVYFNANFRGEPVRIVAFFQQVLGNPERAPVMIEVAQTQHSYKILSDRMWEHTVQQQLAILLLVGLLLLLGLRHGLAPLMRLRDRVQRRKPGALEELDAAPVPTELAPLVHAINDYVQRLDEHMSAQGRFLANASHQLRTPLAVLNTQVNYGLRSDDSAGKDAALRAINKGIQHGIRLVNQLLTLSNAETGIGHPLRQSDVNLIEVVQRVIEEQATVAQSKRIDLGFEFCTSPVTVRATPVMLEELVANLLDNALRYTPAGGIVTVAVDSSQLGALLRVEDNGPGIPEAERGRVFERFYRLQEERSDGSGLGLAIVREIAVASRAEVTLSTPACGSGLLVTVSFPPLPGAAPAAQ